MATNVIATVPQTMLVLGPQTPPGPVSGIGGAGDGNKVLHETRIVPTGSNTERTIAVRVPKGYEFVLEGMNWFAEVVPADAGGTVLGDVTHRDASANTTAVLVDDDNLEGLTALEGSPCGLETGIVLPRILDEYDSLYADAVASEALDTAGVVLFQATGYYRRKS